MQRPIGGYVQRIIAMDLIEKTYGRAVIASPSTRHARRDSPARDGLVLIDPPARPWRRDGMVAYELRNHPQISWY
jgi:hypothetical protein